MLTQPYDDTAPLPDGADTELRSDSPRLTELRAAYAATDLPVTVPSVWSDEKLGSQLELCYFRGENPFVWHYRESPRAMALKYFIFAEYVRAHDPDKLLDRLGEDGAFGCWTFDYAGYPKLSRDLLDSVNELLFLERHVGILDRPRLPRARHRCGIRTHGVPHDPGGPAPRRLLLCGRDPGVDVLE